MFSSKILFPGLEVFSMDGDKCDQYVEVIKQHCDPLMYPGTSYKKNNENFLFEGGLFLEHRKCLTFETSKLNHLAIDDVLKSVTNLIGKQMLDFSNCFIKKYTDYDLIEKHNIHIVKYVKGDYFTLHADDRPVMPRTVSATLYLNDEYGGGEICFKHLGITYRPKKGECLVFSSSFPYSHYVKEITEGTRYVVVNFYSYV
jgi:hypothetical protein